MDHQHDAPGATALLNAMDAALRDEADAFSQARSTLVDLDDQLLRAGWNCFGSPAAFAVWLATPAPWLGGKRPFLLLSTAEGRSDLHGLIEGISHGNVL